MKKLLLALLISCSLVGIGYSIWHLSTSSYEGDVEILQPEKGDNWNNI